MYKNCRVWKYVRKTKRISCFAVKWVSMTVAIYSISWSIVISNCIIIHVLTLQINLVHQITVCKCEKWEHLPEMGFKSRRSNIMKICAFITICFWKCWVLLFWCVGWFIWKRGKSVMVKGRFPYGWHHAFYPYGRVWSPHSSNVLMDIGNLLAWENSVLSELIILCVTTWTMTVLKQMLAISLFLNVRFKDNTYLLGTSYLGEQLLIEHFVSCA